MTRSVKAERRATRKQRREIERRVEGARRSRTMFGALALVALAMFLLCALELWCAFPLVVHMLAFSSLTGLFLGATIRVIRERRELHARELPRAPTRSTEDSP